MGCNQKGFYQNGRDSRSNIAVYLCVVEDKQVDAELDTQKEVTYVL